MSMNPAHKKAASRGLLLLASAMLVGCQTLTDNKPEIVAAVDAACGFIPAAVALAGGSVDGTTAEGLALACVAAKAGSRAISVTVYADPALGAACAGPVTGSAAYVGLRRKIGC